MENYELNENHDVLQSFFAKFSVMAEDIDTMINRLSVDHDVSALLVNMRVKLDELNQLTVAYKLLPLAKIISILVRFIEQTIKNADVTYNLQDALVLLFDRIVIMARDAAQSGKIVASMIRETEQIAQLLIQKHDSDSNDDILRNVIETLTCMPDELNNDADFEISQADFSNDDIIPEDISQERIDGYLFFFQGLSKIIDNRHPNWHQRTPFLLSLALAMNARSNHLVDTNQLIAAVLLHDIALLQLPDSVLDQVDNDIDVEQLVFMDHPDQARSLLASLNGWEGAAKIVYEHHERPDGKGFPEGIVEKNTCEGAKLIAVCDAFYFNLDRSKRYLVKHEVLGALKKINADSGIRFSTQWVTVLSDILHQLLKTSGHDDINIMDMFMNMDSARTISAESGLIPSHDNDGVAGPENPGNIERNLVFFQKLSKMMDVRHKHWKQRTEFLLSLALNMNSMTTDPVDLDQLKAAIYMHDVTMLQVPDNVLFKKGRYDDDDRQKINTHCTAAHDILTNLDGWSEAAGFVLQHHERADGGGYPNGLSDFEMSVGAKIIAICDVCYSMTHNRQDRQSKRDIIRARAEINACSGTQFSSALIRVFNHATRVHPDSWKRKIRAFLKTSRYFYSAPDSALSTLAEILMPSTHAQNDVILKEGDNNNRIYFLFSGHVGIYIENEHVITLNRKGDLFGEVSIIDNQSISTRVVALTKVTTLSISASYFKKSFDNVTELSFLLTRLLSVILTDKLWLTSLKAKKFEATNRILKALSLERQETAQAVIKDALIVIIIVDADGTVVDINPAGEALLECQKNDMLGQSIGKYVFVPDADTTDSIHVDLEERQNTQENGFSLPGYYPLFPHIRDDQNAIASSLYKMCLCLRPDGQRRIVEVGLSAIKIEDELHYTLFLRDITAQITLTHSLEKALQDAKAASAAKTRFLATMSHEIRTPMNAVLGMGELLNRTSLTQIQNGYVHSILSSGTHLLNLINDILDFSKIEADKMELEKTEFDLDDLLEGLVNTFSPLSMEKGVACVLGKQPNLPNLLMGDPNRLRQVLTNLLGNALKFTSNGQIAVAARCHTLAEDNVEVLVSVKDSGIGMTPETVANLFKAFTQGDQSTSREFGGTGLGLTIAKQLLGLMGSTIDVESESGKGSTFSFRVVLESGPIKPQADAKALSGTLVTEKELQQIRGARVLLVEDNELNQQVARELLVQTGVFVELAADGQEAIDWMSREDAQFDLVFMDIQMPKVNGYDAAKAIRFMPRWSEIPMIALTAHATFVERDRTMDAGMNDFLSKPFRPEAMDAMLVKWIQPGERDVEDLADSNIAQTEVELDDFPDQLPGIDVKAALEEHLRGNKKLLTNLLTSFFRDYRQIDQVIIDALKDNNIEYARRMAHSIKSVSGNLAARDLRKAAMAIEESLLQHPAGDAMSLPFLLDDFSRALPDVVEAGRIVTEWNKPKQTSPVDLAKLLQDLGDLNEKVKDFNPSALTSWEPLKPQLESLPVVQSQLENLDRSLDQYDFSAAEGYLDEIIKLLR